MTAKLWLLEALDTLFFRDSRPFIMGETDSRGIMSSFPPAMSTLQGAVRTALAMGQGWRKNGEVAWPEEVLGSFDNLGNLRLQGPYLARNTARGLEFLFPFPASVVRSKDKFLHLMPDEEATWTDLSANSRLPKITEVEDLNEVGELWLTCPGLAKILAGQQPLADEVVKSSDLWRYENRAGIQINERTRTVEQGALYSLAHIRPYSELRLALIVSGIPVHWHQAAPHLVPLGGESRMVKVHIQDYFDLLPTFPDFPTNGDKLRFSVTLITPGHFGKLINSDTEPLTQVQRAVENVVRRGPLPQFGDCVSACIPKLTRVGGWDIINRRPRPLRPVIVPGSTWFYETEIDRRDEVVSLHGSHVGESCEYGYGQIIIGKWGN
ncbi:MAG: type III-B CRISPR module-associated Cmr3 family protein [Bacillota bacterium]|jgi:CRISPR-associated protein Cmr3